MSQKQKQLNGDGKDSHGHSTTNRRKQEIAGKKVKKHQELSKDDKYLHHTSRRWYPFQQESTSALCKWRTIFCRQMTQNYATLQGLFPASYPNMVIIIFSLTMRQALLKIHFVHGKMDGSSCCHHQDPLSRNYFFLIFVFARREMNCIAADKKFQVLASKWMLKDYTNWHEKRERKVSLLHLAEEEMTSRFWCRTIRTLLSLFLFVSL